MAQIFIKIFGRPNSGFENIIDSGDCSFYNIDDNNLLGTIEQYFSIVSRKEYVIYKLVVNNINRYNNGRPAALHISFAISKGYKLGNEKSPYDVLMRLKELFFEKHLEKSTVQEIYSFKTLRIDKEDAQALCNEIRKEFPLTTYKGPYRYMNQYTKDIGGIKLTEDQIKELLKDINYPEFKNYCEVVIATNRIDNSSIKEIKDLEIPRTIRYQVTIDGSTPVYKKENEKITVKSKKDSECYNNNEKTFTIEELLKEEELSNDKSSTFKYDVSTENETLIIDTTPLATAKTKDVTITVNNKTEKKIGDLLTVWYEKNSTTQNNKTKSKLYFKDNSYKFKLEGDEISDFKNGKYTIKLSIRERDNKLKLSGEVYNTTNNDGTYQINTTQSRYQNTSNFSYNITLDRIKPQPKEQPAGRQTDKPFNPGGGPKNSNTLTVQLVIDQQLDDNKRNNIEKENITKIILEDGSKELKIKKDYPLKPDKRNYNPLKAEIPLPDGWDLNDPKVSLWIGKKKHKPKSINNNNQVEVKWSSFKDEWTIDLPTVSITVLLSTILTLLLCIFLLGTYTGYVNQPGIKKILQANNEQNNEEDNDNQNEANTESEDSIIIKAREGYKSLTKKGLELTFEEIKDLHNFFKKNINTLTTSSNTSVQNFRKMIPQYYSFVNALEKNNSSELYNIKSYILSDVHKELLDTLRNKKQAQLKQILPVNSFEELEKKLNQGQTQLSGGTAGGTGGSQQSQNPTKSTCQYCNANVTNLKKHLQDLSGKFSYNHRNNKYYGNKHPHYYKCDQCNQGFDTNNELTVHKQRNHQQ